MAKIVFFILIVFAAWLFFRARGRAAPRCQEPPAASPEAMVSCARCGVHVPMSESLEAAGRRYCSQEHLRLDSGNVFRG
ncbi:MAG: PP0621 family protein [Candidatus Nitricoxidivorans perseverans]|uniref:PP0621 family protein n=1 Tax=Candidatus Nitricoxidivorans perseverans TaxID=2975601 RepID=A0AA49FK17_9PROT|nr:MAG: PP0621 family protein [Candidatus Nitricoxidivorans perseverans]